MDQGAIQTIQNTAVRAAEADRISDAAGHVLAINLPNNRKIASLEEYSPGRRRFRGNLTTNVLAELVGYTKRRATEADPAEPKPSVFINSEQLSAVAFFNLGNIKQPGHADDRATLNMRKTAAYKAVEAIDGKKFDQKQVVEWLEDWADRIKVLNDTGAEAGFMHLSAAIAAIRRIKIKEKRELENNVTNTGGSRSLMEDIDATAEGGLPAMFLFECEPYLGLQSRSVRVRVSVMPSGEKPIIGLRIVQKEELDEAIALEFKGLLFTDLEQTAALNIGTFSP